ncbi:MAG: hypothetical protein ABIW83_03020 [Allosphingosinicella sp.]
MPTQEEMQEPKQLEEIMRAAGYLQAANDLLAQRFNYSLVAHSMAMTAYATCLDTNPFVAGVVSIFGAGYALVQYLITSPLTKRIDALRKAYLLKDPVYLVYNKADGGRRPRGLQSILVPFALLALWVILLFYAIHQVPPEIAPVA